ncbi:VIT family protein [Spongiibacter sp.]|uniref:VIT1/CCC1 transporter family protein n=1 Tax=Spongiibacter sp. TaxID=2024860 RepID=UPI00356551C2
MFHLRQHHEKHRTSRIAWLRAAVLGANDGIVSTASLLLGVAAAGADSGTLMLTGFAGLVAGAMSMAAGEYVSVSSQADIERADIEIERRELASNPLQEHEELAGIYVQRGLDKELADQVAGQLMAHDALAAHSRDELGLSPNHRARPLLAALSSASSFAVGGALPLMLALWFAPPQLLSVMPLAILLFLATLGASAAYAGGAPVLVAALRVAFWGAAAMALTAAVGHSFGLLL